MKNSSGCNNTSGRGQMHIHFVEIRNFRKLRSVRVDFSETTTLLVGANNSGKTSAMLALRHFLVDHSYFSTNDFTLSQWPSINGIGSAWQLPNVEESTKHLALTDWEHVLPSLDVWLEVGNHELHYVRDLLPTLDWAGGLIGVRLRFEPGKVEDLRKEYLTAWKAAKETRELGNISKKSSGEYTLTLWPNDLRDFLDRHLHAFFTVRTYLLDPTKRSNAVHGIASPQSLPGESDPIDNNPLRQLIQINEISAHRELSASRATPSDKDGYGGRQLRSGKLSQQLREYYDRHLDPSDHPELEDLDALQAIEAAQGAFDGRLKVGFSNALAELQTLNYPGVLNPELTISTRLRPTDGLSHDAAVQYAVAPDIGKAISAPRRLPEEYNGLGYQNLISMVFQLMAFRDAWMRVGKYGKLLTYPKKGEHGPRPLQLVLIEEPEAHLHCQVQQVFVRQAYKVLRNQKDLAENNAFTTQLVVSTHSSHVAHEIEFSCLRYFRRLPAAKDCDVPFTSVINLSEVFGTPDETTRFVTRYLRATHADLFFADAAILVEGPSERLLVPYFIRKRFKLLDRAYISLLEIGGSHAQRLRPLIEHLGLTTLIITDLDSADAIGHHMKVAPSRKRGQVTRNATLKHWHPMISSVDSLLDLPDDKKILTDEEHGFSIRVAYQAPIPVTFDTGNPEEALATTLEDALVFENLQLFKTLDVDGSAKDVKEVINVIKANPKLEDLSRALQAMLKDFEKVAFALDLLLLKDLEKVAAPRYILDGLRWLESELNDENVEMLAAAS